MSLIALAHAPAPTPPPLTSAAIAFYATVATFIPVLYLALAVQGNASQSMFGAARVIMKHIIRSLTRTMFRNAATGRPQNKVEISLRAIFIFVVAGTIPLAAAAIIVAGALGEILAAYALYQGQDTPPTRTIVLYAAVFLIIAVATGPAVTFIKIIFTFPRQIFWDIAKEVTVGGVKEVILKKVILGGMATKYKATVQKFQDALEKTRQDPPPQPPGSSPAEPAQPETGKTDPGPRPETPRTDPTQNTRNLSESKRLLIRDVCRGVRSGPGSGLFRRGSLRSGRVGTESSSGRA